MLLCQDNFRCPLHFSTRIPLPASPLAGQPQPWRSLKGVEPKYPLPFKGRDRVGMEVTGRS